ncbi:MAG: hypothetical protein MI892_21080 [Desulfobacterales bacterium]|nr:hypothetical protein [Desulfobacterales bacterium]
MEMTYKVGNTWKDFLYRIDNPFAHIMYERPWFTILLFEAAEKGNEFIFFLRWNLDRIQNQFRKSVNATKQIRAITFTRPVNMENVSAPSCEKLSKSWSALPVCQGKVNNELAAQKTDFPLRDEYILGCQLSLDLLVATAAKEKGQPDLNDDIKSKSTAFGYEFAELFRSKFSVLVRTIQHYFFSQKGADVHGNHCLRFCFLNIGCRMAFGAF